MQATASKFAAKFRISAAAQEAKIEHLRRPLTQNSTPKRQREYNSRCIDGDNLDRCRLAMIALADAHDRGDVPDVLAGVKTKDEVYRLVRHGIVSNGYFHVASDHTFADKSPAGVALQNLLAASMGTTSLAEQEATRKKRELEGMIDRVRFLDIPGFFPTPRELIEVMLAKADLHNGQMILEPSAGLGSIADVIAERFRLESEPGDDCVRLTCIEVNYSLFEICRAKGYDAIRGDFLETSATPAWDRIIMTPPFERAQDIDHILHAYNSLKDGGRLVAIGSTGPFFRTDAKSVEYRQFLDDVGAEVSDIPAGAFNGAGVFRATGISTKMIVIQK